MTKVIAVTRGSTGQTNCAYLVHPDKFNLDENDEPISVKLSELPVEPNSNNGQGVGFYLAKGFIDPAQFLEYAEYKSFKKKNKEAAALFEDTALEESTKAKARAKEEEEDRVARLSADHLRHTDKKRHPGDKVGVSPGTPVEGVTTSDSGPTG